MDANRGGGRGDFKLHPVIGLSSSNSNPSETSLIFRAKTIASRGAEGVCHPGEGCRKDAGSASELRFSSAI